jgi:hypothetical protein
MNENQIQTIALEIFNNKLIDEVPVENQLNEILKNYPEDLREEIEDCFFEIFDAESSI